MINPVSKFFMAAVFIYALMISAAWADRVLIDDPLQTVSVSSNFSCYQPANITVDTTQPSLYEQATQLQALSDSVRAMLSYECPQLSAIKLTGLIRGLNEVVYQGELSRNNNWLIRQVTATDNQQYDNQTQSGEQENWTANRYDDELVQGQLDVTGIRLGMSADQVSEIITQTFAVEPHYDVNNGLMTMNPDVCSSGVVETNSKCLKAWFSDNRIARLERIELIQVVQANQQQVNNRLIDKYGNPIETRTNQDGDKSEYIWRAINQSKGLSSLEEINVAVSENQNDGVTTEIILYSPDTVTSANNEQMAEMDLKL